MTNNEQPLIEQESIEDLLLPMAKEKDGEFEAELYHVLQILDYDLFPLIVKEELSGEKSPYT